MTVQSLKTNDQNFSKTLPNRKRQKMKNLVHNGKRASPGGAVIGLRQAA